MDEHERAELMVELERAGIIYLPMKWHNELHEIADLLLNDGAYKKEDAAADIIKVMRDMQREIGGTCMANSPAVVDLQIPQRCGI